MFKTVVTIFFYSFTSSAIASEVLYSSNNPDQSSPISRELISYLKTIPRFSSEIDPNQNTTSHKCYLGPQAAQMNNSPASIGISLEGMNGCLGYKIQEELVNKSSEATLTRKDHQATLGFNIFDSMIKFIKNNDFEKAY